MIRRNFIKSISAFSIAPLFSWFHLFGGIKKTENKKEGVREIIAIQNASDLTFQLHWENPMPIMDAGPPTNWTWRKYLTEAYGYLEEDFSEDNIKRDWGDYFKSSDLDKLCPQDEVDEWWYEHGVTTTSDVFYYLQDVKLSDELYNQLEWYEYTNPGSNYVGIEVLDRETLYELENELNELGEKVKFKIINDWEEL